MKKLLLLLFTFLTLVSIAQNKRIENHIQKLDNSQFVIDHHAKATFSYNSPSANKLIKIGKRASPKLIEALNDPKKIIMAHFTLCHIYFKHVSFAGPKEQSVGDEIVYKYYLGEEKGEGLIISETKKAGEFTTFIEPKDKEDILNYWKNKSGSIK